jgi:hypothetical protein
MKVVQQTVWKASGGSDLGSIIARVMKVTWAKKSVIMAMVSTTPSNIHNLA